MRKATMLLAVLLAASVATSADARKRVRHHHRAVAAEKVVAVMPDARERAAAGIFGLFLPTGAMILYANSPMSPYK
jgi:hypothetical protein